MAAGAGHADAEDAAQGAMVAAHRQWHDIGSPRAWVRKVALRDLRKRQRRLVDGIRRAVLGGWANEARRPEPTDVLLEGVHVLGLLDRLAPKQRTVMALHLDGFAATETAEIMGIPPATVRSHLRHAREQLRETIAELRAEERR